MSSEEKYARVGIFAEPTPIRSAIAGVKTRVSFTIELDRPPTVERVHALKDVVIEALAPKMRHADIIVVEVHGDDPEHD